MPKQTALHLGEHLLEKGLITQEMLTVTLEEQRVTGDRLGAILVRNGFVTQRDLIDAIHAVDMSQISAEQALITQCPAQVLIDTHTMVLAETDSTVYVATLSDESEVREALRPYYKKEEIVFNAVNVDLLDEYLDKIEQVGDEEGAMLDRLLRRGLRHQVTDIHVYAPKQSSYSVFFRHLGVLHHAHEGDLEEYQRLIAQVKDRSSLDLAERRVPQDGAFQVDYNGRFVDMRVATLPTIGGEKVVIRLLDPDRINPRLSKLGISRISKWRAGTSEAHGICLICGPTGSGKTTTLNATVREMDRFGKSINTLEDPVEYQIPYVTQMNINHTVGLDFSRGLRAYMRGDPDVVIVGEIRDLETAEHAIKAAETGHLVIGTLHTGSIHGTLDRLRDIGVDTKQLRYLLRAILVQRLMRVYCGHCGGDGCDTCMGTGYASRTVVSETEYFSGEEEVDRLAAGDRWWPTMIDDAVSKCQAGMTSTEEVVRVFGEPARKALIQVGFKDVKSMIEQTEATESTAEDAAGA